MHQKMMLVQSWQMPARWIVQLVYRMEELVEATMSKPVNLHCPVDRYSSRQMASVIATVLSHRSSHCTRTWTRIRNIHIISVVTMYHNYFSSRFKIGTLHLFKVRVGCHHCEITALDTRSCRCALKAVCSLSWPEHILLLFWWIGMFL